MNPATVSATTDLPTEPATTVTPTTEATNAPTNLPSDVCGGPGWRRVAFINMTDPNQDCPQGLNLTDYSIRSCGRAHSEGNCSSPLVFPVNGSQYSQVCGRVTAYRWGATGAFVGYNSPTGSIDGVYVDGLSLTHGSPRTHIWTFASGIFNGITSDDPLPEARCPCDPGNTFGSPSFVGNDYFCESVATLLSILDPYQFFPDNALWDGQDHLNPCYGLNNPPWFNKTLPVPTTDDIEFRMCLINRFDEANIALQLLEIFVQ